VLLIAIVGVGCTSATHTDIPVPTDTPSPTATPTLIPTLTPTAINTPTTTPTPTATPIPRPMASFSLDLSSGIAPFTVQLSDTSQGPLSCWQWAFGDGASSTEQNPTNEYTQAGTYTVTLTVSGPGGISVAMRRDAIIVNPGPLSDIVVSPTQVTLQTQGTNSLAVTAVDQFGNGIRDVGFTWSTLGPNGSVDVTGKFTAGTKAGIYEGLIKVTATQGVHSREALIDVTIDPGPLSIVLVEPSEVTLDIGDAEPFTVTVLDEFGNEISDAIVSWSVAPDAGHLDLNGILTAGTKSGEFPEGIKIQIVEGTTRVTATVGVAVGLGVSVGTGISVGVALVQPTPTIAIRSTMGIRYRIKG